MSKSLKIVIAVIICLAIGYGSGIATQSSITTWYPTLNKPFFNPPNWLFAPVWTILYVMMGVSAGLVWSKMEVIPLLVKKHFGFLPFN
ncbi:TspO/MBR family protein [Flavobacterium piscinae]|uniref:TspO/MBR family protein n=1 Tax=Flavobacterium piscinae TaxID=2506424 RepID=UPI002AAAE293|nr:TspO/MBR family protein [Flavobacterium piscinae]